MYNLESVIKSIKMDIQKAAEELIIDGALPEGKIPEFIVEVPAQSDHGELSANAALVSAKTYKMSPRKIAEMILQKLKLPLWYAERVEIAGPGFINFFLSNKFFLDSLKEIENYGENYGKSNYGTNKKVMVEFVSANPTGPMHMGNARLGALGDCLSEILRTCGWNVYKEFYVNDAGNQIEKFALSLDVRYRQICNGADTVLMPEDCYQGQDITELAKDFYDKYANSYIKESEETRKKALVDFALPKNIERMQNDMEKYKIIYDNWFYESDLYKSGEVNRVIDFMTANGFTYEKEGCVWYKATEFGLEKDEVLRRKNGIPTYFAADIAYHFNKFATRDFDLCIDIWGADHHGHVARMHGAMQALGIKKNRLHVILVQLVRLMKSGEIVRMSKRTGKSVQLSDLLDEVSPDAARFIFNTREANCGMDFDLDLAVKQDSQNPLYYVQYAHARICSIFSKLSENDKIDFKKSKISITSLLPEERKLIYLLASYPEELIKSAQNFDPTKITHYVVDLATAFHKFYSVCKVVSKDENLTNFRLLLCLCVKTVLKNVLDMFKVNAPESMVQ